MRNSWNAVSVKTICILLFAAHTARADEIELLIESSCIVCHDVNTETRLDFTRLERNFEDADTFRTWVTVFDRVRNGEMPPKSEPRPEAQTQSAALTLLKSSLGDVNRRQQQEHGRVSSRRLSRAEYEQTLHDALGINGDIAKHLPAENPSGSFDVIAGRQYRVEITASATTQGTGEYFANYNIGFTSIPQPGAVALLGLAGLVARRRR